MINTTKGLRILPGCEIPGPVSKAGPGDSAHMRASGGQSNHGTRRSIGFNPKKVRKQNIQHQQSTSDGLVNCHTRREGTTRCQIGTFGRIKHRQQQRQRKINIGT